MAQLVPNPDLFGNPIVATFELAVRNLTTSCQENSSGARQRILEAVAVIDSSVALSERERGRRIEAVLRSVTLNRGDYEAIAVVSADLRPASRNAVLSILPQDLRPTVYKTKAAGIPTVDLYTASSASPPLDKTRTGETAANDHSPFRTVLLLGSEEEHESNTSLLRRHGITVLRRQQMDGLEEIVRSDVAGVVVAGSIWKTAAPTDHELLLLRFLQLSSVLFLRIDVEGLNADAAGRLIDLRRGVCCAEADASVFCHGSGCRLSPADVTSIQRVAGLLDVSASTRFHPQEIGSSESLLVRIAATKHVRGHRLDHGIRLEQIQTSFFSQGRSQAKVAMVRPDDGGPGLVMKVDKPERLRAEMQKYFRYISRWEGKANPELYFHGDAAAIIFSLVDNPDAPGAPAPTLDEQIEKAMNGELGNWGETPPQEADLTLALERTVTKLMCLNCQPCMERGYGYGWMADTIGQLADKQIVWSIKDMDGNDTLLPDLARRAATVVAALQDNAVVHGDVHLMNILLRDNRDPFLIDFALSGPGHPCYDLTRLEAAVLFRSFRAVAPESRIAAFVAAISVQGASYADLERDYRDLLTSIGNRLAARTSILVRQQCLDLLAKRNATPASYHAMKILVSASALTMLQPQSAICRATLSALAPVLS